MIYNSIISEQTPRVKSITTTLRRNKIISEEEISEDSPDSQ